MSLYDNGVDPHDSRRVTFRNATAHDVPLLEQWDQADHIRAIMGDYEFNEWNWKEEIPRSPPWRQQWVAQIAPTQHSADKRHQLRPIGFVQIINAREEETHYWGVNMEPNVAAVDIWIGEVDCLGQGFGTEMMHQVFRFCFDTWQSKAVVVDPMHDNTAAHRFYVKCGMRPAGYRMFGPDKVCGCIFCSGNNCILANESKCLIHRIDYHEWMKALLEYQYP